MKRNLFCASIGAAVLSLFSISASAQTCASPDTTWTPNAAGSPALSGSTCSHEAGILSACASNFSSPGAAYVALINTAASGSFTNITFTGGSGYTIAAYFVPQASGCNTNAACKTSGDGANAVTHATLGDGAFYMIITGADFDAAGSCGTFTATANGTLPVSLQSFTVDG